MLIETLVFTSMFMGARVEAPPVVSVPVPVVHAVPQPVAENVPAEPRAQVPAEQSAKVSKKLHVDDSNSPSKVEDHSDKMPKTAATVEIVSAGVADDAVGAGIMDSYTDNDGETVYLSMGKQS